MATDILSNWLQQTNKQTSKQSVSKTNCHGGLQGSHSDGVGQRRGGSPISGECSHSYQYNTFTFHFHFSFSHFILHFHILIHITLASAQHGDLRVHVIAARDLPDTDNTFFNISRGDWTDPFVTVFLDQVYPAA